MVDYAQQRMRLLCISMIAFLTIPALTGADAGKRRVEITAVYDGPSPTFDAEVHDLSKEIAAQLSDRFDVVFVPLSFEGDWTAAGVERQLDEAYSNPAIAAVFGFGHLTVKAVAARKKLPTPTILPFVMEGRKQALPRSGDASGKRNLTYIAEDLDVSEEANWLKKVAGSKHIVFLGGESLREMLPAGMADRSISIALAEPRVEALLAAIPNAADAVIIAPIPQLSLEDRVLLLDEITKRRLPNIAVGPSWLAQGAMMSIRSPNSVPRRAQRAALNLDLILEGRPASEMHVDFQERLDLQINLDAARAVGVRPTYEVLLEADTMQSDEVDEENRLDLGIAMLEAVDQNLQLLVSEKYVEAGEEGVKRERGPLLPQGQLQVGVVDRDPDRVPPGSQIAQGQGSTVARASQSIYSAEAWTRFRSRQLRQEGREYGYFSDVLDIMLQAGVDYVAVLRAKAQERIQRENIRLTREYLELARMRLEIGSANASELYRWQVTLAENQRSVVEARALVGQTKVELNRVLNRPLEHPIAPIDLPVDEAGRTRPPRDPIGKYMLDPWSFEHLRDFMVREGLRNSPSAREAEARKAAQERIEKGRTLQIFVPDFAVEGGVEHDFWRDGAGTTIPPLLQGILPQPDKFGWDVGLYLAIPLSRGGAGIANIRESARLVERLSAELARVEQNIDSGVRTELYNAGAAMASVTLTRKAADAAADNLVLVTDLYRRGKVDIIRLVDAQTQNLVAGLAAMNAVYDYLIALLFVNREISHFRNLDTEQAQQEFSRRLNEFVMTAGTEPTSADIAP